MAPLPPCRAGSERGDTSGAARQAVQGLWLGGLCGVLVGTLAVVASEPLVTLLGADGPVREAALTYLRISLVGLPFHFLVLSGTGYVRGLQDTRTPSPSQWGQPCSTW